MQIIGSRLGKSGKGNPQWCVSVKPYAVENSNAPVDSAERWCSLSIEPYERTIFRALTDKSIDYVVQDLDNLGITVSNWGQLDENDPNHVELRGKNTIAVCSHETYEGKEREKWGFARSKGELQIEALSPAEVMQLNALFRDRLFKPMQPAAATPAPMPVTNKPETKDDLPF
ncbi:MAG: hypothetical protein WC505_08065 [Patescibacteria group bacterium]